MDVFPNKFQLIVSRFQLDFLVKKKRIFDGKACRISVYAFIFILTDHDCAERLVS